LVVPNWPQSTAVAETWVHSPAAVIPAVSVIFAL
jgi:hypothetical protein